MSSLMANSVAACPLEMEMTFLTVPLRINGVKVLNRWMFPMQFVLKLSRRVFSNSEGFSSLYFVIFCFFHSNKPLFWHVHDTDRVQLLHDETGIADEVVHATAGDLRSGSSCLLERGIVGDVCLEDMYVRATV